MSYYNQNYGSVPPYINQQYDGGYTNLNVMNINNGAAYFVALAPLFSLFLEGVAGDRISALILWVFTYILCVLVCKYDKNKILSRCYDTTSLEKLIFIPIVYLAVRGTKVTRQGVNCVALCIAALLIAIMRNGFVSYAMTTEDSYVITVEEAAYSEFIDTQEIDNYLNPSVKEVIYGCFLTPRWTCETVKNNTTVTVMGETELNEKNQTVTISFGMWYDGYRFEGIDVLEVTVGETALDEKQIEELFYDLYFIYYNNVTSNGNVVEA